MRRKRLDENIRRRNDQKRLHVEEMLRGGDLFGGAAGTNIRCLFPKKQTIDPCFRVKFLLVNRLLYRDPGLRLSNSAGFATRAYVFRHKMDRHFHTARWAIRRDSRIEISDRRVHGERPRRGDAPARRPCWRRLLCKMLPAAARPHARRRPARFCRVDSYWRRFRLPRGRKRPLLGSPNCLRGIGAAAGQDRGAGATALLVLVIRAASGFLGCRGVADACAAHKSLAARGMSERGPGAIGSHVRRPDAGRWIVLRACACSHDIFAGAFMIRAGQIHFSQTSGS